MSQNPKTILYFDGDCGLCSRSVRFLMRQDKQARLYFAPIQGETAAELLDDSLRQSLSTVVYQRPAQHGGTETLLRSEAVLCALIDIGRHWRYLALLARWFPCAWRNAVYDWIAHNRHRFFLGQACSLPTEAVKARLLP